MLGIFKNLWKGKKSYNFYLAGGMRGYKDLNKPMFDLVSNLLRSNGATVWSPSEHDSYLQLSFAQCMTTDLDAVVNLCQRIVFLPGWRKSLGANVEAFSAFSCGKPAFEVVLNDDKTDLYLIGLDLVKYTLPYYSGETHNFNPHQCGLNSFDRTEE